MTSFASEFSRLVFQRNNVGDYSGSDLNIQTYNVFMSFDGKRSIEMICREDIYDVPFLAEKIQQLLSQGLIEPVTNGLDAIVVQQMVASICNGQEAGDQAAAAPAAEADNQNKAIAEISGYSPPANVVFVTMVTHMFDYLKKTDARHMSVLRTELLKAVAKMKVKNGYAQAISQWLRGQVRLISTELPLDLMRNVMTQVYTFICEYYGPGVADSALQNAAKACNELPEAQEVSLRNFL